MSTPAPVPVRRRGPKQKKSLLKMDLSSLGRKSAADDDEVDHQPFSPTLPRVNLLPASITESIAVRKVRRILAVAAVVLALAVAGLWYLQGSRISEAEAALASAQAQHRVMQAKVDALAPVKDFYSQLAGQRQVVEAAMASQPQASLVELQLMEAARAAGNGSDLFITDMNVTYTGIPEAGGTLNECATPDPFSKDITIGCVTFNATAANRQQVSDFLVRLEADPLFVGPYVDNSSFSTAADQGAAKLTFGGTVGISLAGLTTALTDEQVAALRLPPTPTPTPTAGGK